IEGENVDVAAGAEIETHGADFLGIFVRAGRDVEVRATDTIHFAGSIGLSGGAGDGRLHLTAPNLNVRDDVRLRGGTVRADVDTVDLGGFFYGTGGGLLGRNALTGTAANVNVLAPVASIQQAVDLTALAANADILVGAGDYNQSVDVYKSVRISG